MKAVILANEAPVKLTPIIEATTLSTVPLANKALIEHLLEQLAQAGVTQAFITAERPSGQIESLWEGKGHPPLPLRFTFGREMTGSANAIRRLKNDLTDTFVVIDCQHLVSLDLENALEHHRQSGAVATVIATRIAAPWAVALKAAYEAVGNNGTISSSARTSPAPEFNFRLTAPEACDSGFYILEPKVFEYITDNQPFKLEDLMARLSGVGQKVNTYLLDGEVRDLSTLGHYWQANMDMLIGKMGKLSYPATATEIKPGIWIGANCKIHPAARLQAPLIIGANCKIDQDAKLENSVIGDSVIVEQGAQVRNSVVFPQTQVGLAVKLVDTLVRGNLLCQGPRFEPEWVNDLYSLSAASHFKMGDLLRRVFNCTAAAAMLLAFSPVMIIAAIAIKLDSPGPFFYRQLRVGQGRPGGRNLRSGRVFKIYKFRTMYVDADDRLAEVMKQNEYKNQAFIKIKNDPRITHVGNFLRKTSIDELPQLINVVLGDMQLVGNRPLPTYEAEALGEEWQKLRFNAPAGITGLWQISGRSDLSAEERLVLDNYYAVTHSFWGDIKILLMTLPALLKARGAR